LTFRFLGLSLKWRVLVVCTVAFSVAHACRLVLSPILPLAKAEFNLNYLQTSIFSSSFDLGYAVGLLSMAFLGNILEKKRMVMLSMLLVAVMSTYTGLASSYWHLLVSRLLGGFGYSLYLVAGISVISDHFMPEERGKSMGFHSTGSAFGRFYGALIGGSVTAMLGWREAFYVTSLVAASVFILVWVGLQRTRSEEAPSVSFKLHMNLDRRIVSLVPPQSAATIFFISMFTFIPLQMVEVAGFSAEAVGFFFAVTSITTVVANPFIGHLSDRVGKREASILFLVVGAALSFIFPYIRFWGHLILFSVGLGVTIGSTIFILLAYVTEVTMPVSRAPTLGVFNGTAVGITLVSMVFFGHVADWLGLGVVFHIQALILLAAAALSYAYRPL